MQIKKIQRDALFDFISFTIVFVHLTIHLFYLQPFQKPTKGILLEKLVIMLLKKTVKRVYSEAGMVGYYTNHSIRATAATRLYHHNIEKQQIMERTGHHGAEAVRSYKRT